MIFLTAESYQTINHNLYQFRHLIKKWKIRLKIKVSANEFEKGLREFG